MKEQQARINSSISEEIEYTDIFAGHPEAEVESKLPASDYMAVFKPKITVFHCFNAFFSTDILESDDEYEISAVRMPCSSMTREVFLLRAFEAGADAVVVLVCPEGECRYLEGNIRAGKKVISVRKILDEIGFDGRRLNIFPVSQKDVNRVESIIKKVVRDLAVLGPNPAYKI